MYPSGTRSLFFVCISSIEIKGDQIMKIKQIQFYLKGLHNISPSMVSTRISEKLITLEDQPI